jgi:phospholipase/carboxylesterase
MQKLEHLGGLTCRTIQQLAESDTPELVVILCHGFGAPGTDLVPIGPEILGVSERIAETTQFIFPEAPLSLADIGMPGGRAWWHIDMERLIGAAERGEFRDLRNDHPDELPAAREKLLALIDEVRGRTGLPMSKIVLGGFSQGSMLSTDVALRLDDPPAALCVWSGTLLCEDSWRELAAKRGPLRVLQSHGRTDPILPFEASLWLRDLFRESGFEIEFIEFNGTHTIPYEAMAGFVQLLESICDGAGE